MHSDISNLKDTYKSGDTHSMFSAERRGSSFRMIGGHNSTHSDGIVFPAPCFFSFKDLFKLSKQQRPIRDFINQKRLQTKELTLCYIITLSCSLHVQPVDAWTLTIQGSATKSDDSMNPFPPRRYLRPSCCKPVCFKGYNATRMRRTLLLKMMDMQSMRKGTGAV